MRTTLNSFPALVFILRETTVYVMFLPRQRYRKPRLLQRNVTQYLHFIFKINFYFIHYYITEYKQ